MSTPGDRERPEYGLPAEPDPAPGGADAASSRRPEYGLPGGGAEAAGGHGTHGGRGADSGRGADGGQPGGAGSVGAGSVSGAGTAGGTGALSGAVPVGYDLERAAQEAERIRSGVLVSRIAGLLTVGALIAIGLTLVAGPLRWLFLVAAVLIALARVLFIPQIALMNASRAERPATGPDGSVMTLTPGGLVLPRGSADASGGSLAERAAGTHPWADVQFVELTPGGRGPRSQLRVRVPGGERVFMREALSLDLAQLLAARDRLRG